MALTLAGCASVGDPLPPALYIPERASDFAIVQRGPSLVATFTAPSLTTESLAIRELTEVELRIGPLPDEFTYDSWAATAEAIPLNTPQPGERVEHQVPAARWAGREVLAAVRFRGSRGRYSEWSNSVVITPRAPLPAPVVTAEPHPEGIRVSWAPVPGATQYRVLREGSSPVTVNDPEYIDRTVELGKTYTYTVAAIADKAESPASAPAAVAARDTFPPAPPSGVTIVAGLKSIELAWNRSTEQDLASFRVYRAEGSGEFTVLADAVEGTAYSDRQVEAGKTYRYRVTALDRSANESDPSVVVQASAQ